jgi:type I restriction enzyme R subunit
VAKAVTRAKQAKWAEERGGIVWHTQGSGKSLTMLGLAIKLRRDEAHENPTLVLATDRVDLDEQINKTFLACGFVRLRVSIGQGMGDDSSATS